MARGKRYDSNSKLNIKKVIAVIVLFLVIVMFVLGIRALLTTHSKSTSGKIETVTFYTIYDNGKWGVINSYGETVIKPMYNEMIVIPDNTKPVFICTYDVDYSKGTYKSKALNESEKDIITGYDKVETLANYSDDLGIWYEKNVLRVQKNQKYGLVDFSGKELLKCEYENIEALQGIENSLIITKDGKIGLCDNLGNVIIEPKYQKVEKIEDNYKNGYIVVDSENKYGIIGFDKSVILECKYEEIKGIYGGSNLFVIKTDGKYQVINKSGDTVLEDKFDEAEAISGDYIVAEKGGKYGVVDINGETKINFEYNQIKVAGKNYIAKKANKFGVIDIEENEKIPFDYININYVPAGDLFVADYIENENLVSKIYDQNFKEKLTGTVLDINTAKGYIRVNVNGEYKYYNFKFEEKQSSTLLTTNSLFLSKKNGKYGFLDKDGKVVVDYIYDDATEQNTSGYAAIKKDGLWGSIDTKGNVVIKPEYNLDNNVKIDFIGSWHLCEDINANYYLDV